MTDDLMTWLTAGIEAVRLAAVPPRLLQGGLWRMDAEPWAVGTGIFDEMSRPVATAVAPYVAQHLVCNSPVAVLARCDADLAILAEHEHVSEDADRRLPGPQFGCRVCHVMEDTAFRPMVVHEGWCRTVRLLGWGWRHLPGYQGEWAPDPLPATI